MTFPLENEFPSKQGQDVIFTRKVEKVVHPTIFFNNKPVKNEFPSKQAQEVVFTRKVEKVVHPPIFFNNKPVQQTSSQKHLGLKLDTSLTFNEHLKAIASKVSKIIGLLWKLNNRLPLSSLTTIYKHS